MRAMKRWRAIYTPGDAWSSAARIGLVWAGCVLSLALRAEVGEATARPEDLGSLQARLAEQIARPSLSAASLGVKIISLETGQTWFEHQANKLLKPASNAKLYSGALALDRLGPDFRIRTSLFAATRPDEMGTLHGDLIIYGRGDPSWAARFNNGDSAKSLDPVVDAVAVAGLKRIEGNLIADESFFRGPPFGSSWNWDDLQYYYGAEVSALTVEDNVVDLVLRPGPSVGSPCAIQTRPETTFLNFINQTTTGGKETVRRIDLDRPIAEGRVFVTGQLPIGGSNWTDAVSVPRPAAWFGTRLKEALARRGVAVTGGVQTIGWRERETNRLAEARLVEIGIVESRPLREILSRTLKPSQNLYAQLLLLQVGAWSAGASHRASKPANDNASPPRGPASPGGSTIARTTEELGLAEMARWLQEAGIDPREVRLDEGSGLSRSCLVTPNATVTLLGFMSRHREAEIFRESLPVAGVDGSLRNRMKQTKASGNLRAKTGSLRYVDALSGYVTTAGGERLAFSIMLNNYANSRPSGREIIDGLAVLLADFSGRTSEAAK